MLTAYVAIALLQLAKPTDLVYVRHGETVANATGKYNSKTLNTFSETGEKGVAALTRRLLKEPRFDRILVSPSPRALRTIAPYLRATGQKATVWPLAYECCTGRRPRGVKPTKFTYAGRIELPAEIASLFTFDTGRDRLPNSPDYGAGLAQAAASVAEFRARYAGGRVLVVGHSGHGGQFLFALTGKRYAVRNTTEMRFTLP
ncbi:MAG: histidine phosphatase family protein [Fimbriimonas sp.]